MQTLQELIEKTQGDRVLTLTEQTWGDYVALNLPKQRISYRNGIITIVSPGKNHETFSDLIFKKLLLRPKEVMRGLLLTCYFP